jgi:broad-specificity NMP kinase
MFEHYPEKIIKKQDTVIYQIYASLFDNKDPVMLKLRKLTDKYYKRLERQYYATHRPK